MNLALSNSDPRNTFLLFPDGRAIYRIKTPHNIFGGRTTKIRRVDANDMEIGKIKWGIFSSSKLWVGHRRIEPHKSGTFSHSKIFQAQDGRNYKWKISGGHPQLVVEGHSVTIAIFHKAKRRMFSRSQPASLEIMPQGMVILDDIVTTFVWFEQNRRKRKNAAASAANSN